VKATYSLKEILLALRDSRFSSTVIKNCEVTAEDGEIGHVNLTISSETVGKIWQACIDSIIAGSR